MSLEPIQIRSNLFPLEKEPKIAHVYVYSVYPEIPDDSHALRTQLIRRSARQINELIGFFQEVSLTLVARIRREDPFTVEVSGHNGMDYAIKIHYSGLLTKDNQEAYRAYLNCAVGQVFKNLGFQKLSRASRFYHPERAVPIDSLKLTVWRGYLSSFAHHNKLCLLASDFSSKIIRKETLLDLLARYPISDFNILVHDMPVIPIYALAARYKIAGVSWEENPLSTFSGPEGLKTYREYYIEKYSVNIQDLAQPLLIVHRKDGSEIRLVPELVTPASLSSEQTKDYDIMKKIGEVTQLSSAEHIAETEKCMEFLCHDPRMLNEFDIKIRARPLTTKGYQLVLRNLPIGQGRCCNVERGSFRFNGPLCEPNPVQCCIVISSDRNRGYRKKLIAALRAKTQQFNLEIVFQEGPEFQSRQANTSSLGHVIQQFGRPSIALFLISNDHEYRRVKTDVCTVVGIPSQCIHEKSFASKAFPAIAAKLLIQIAVKANSIPWNAPPIPGLQRETMIIGLDVTHDTANRNQSIAAFIASTYPESQLHFNATTIQGVGQEIVFGVGRLFREALAKWEQHETLPRLIVVYRDGVGDSQIQAVHQHEVEAMKRVIAQFPEYRPHFVYYTVIKDHNVRLYQDSSLRNLDAGTHVNALTGDSDFFLVAHQVTQGIAKPTLYRQVFASAPIKKEVFIQLSFNLCFLYYNWTGSIRIPAPVMKADRLAYMVQQYVRSQNRQVHPGLENSDWFY